MKKYIKDILIKYPKLNYFVMTIYKHTFWKIKGMKANRIFLVNANDVLYALSNVFDELNLQWWLEYGTLLGAIRDNDFISHDVDIDIGLFHDDYSPEIEKIFLKYGFVKKRAFLIDDGLYGREETYSYNGVDVDLFYFKKNGNKLIGYGFKPAEGMTSANTIKKMGGLLVREITFPYEGLKSYMFKGIKVFIPSNAQEHLSAFYGEWREKNKKWNPYTMAKNVKYLDDKVGKYYEF